MCFYSVHTMTIMKCYIIFQAISYLTVTRVGPCLDRKPSELVYVSEMSLYKEKYDFSFSGELAIVADIANGWTVKAMMQKCHDIRNLDTCDFYKSMFVVKDGCLESEEADVYNMVFQYVTPKMECPVRAGNYTIVDFPFFTEDSDLTAAKSKISTSVFGYTYRLEGFNDDDDKMNKALLLVLILAVIACSMALQDHYESDPFKRMAQFERAKRAPFKYPF